MNSQHLSKRLKAVANMVDAGARLADIGSDHAYLPSYLIQKEIIDFAIAGEVAKGPYENILYEINVNSLEDKLQARLASGLKVIKTEDQIDTITIAGMGGILITQILAEDFDKVKDVKHLIIQANTDVPAVRKFLADRNWEIVDENIVFDENHFYEMIKFAKSSKDLSLNDKELYFGPINLKQKNEAFVNYWTKELTRLKKALLAIEKAQKTDTSRYAQLQKEAEMIEEVLVDESL